MRLKEFALELLRRLISEVCRVARGERTQQDSRFNDREAGVIRFQDIRRSRLLGVKWRARGSQVANGCARRSARRCGPGTFRRSTRLSPCGPRFPNWLSPARLDRPQLSAAA